VVDFKDGLISPEEVGNVNSLRTCPVALDRFDIGVRTAFKDSLKKVVEALLDDPVALESYIRAKANEMEDPQLRTSASHRYDLNTGKFVIRHPYYYRDDLIPYLIPHPLHYILFSQFAFYRWIVGGVWLDHHGIWVRMEDRREDELCGEHCALEPCHLCREEWERSQQP
jgi:hypothetical protein